jgi:hypothetical protein
MIAMRSNPDPFLNTGDEVSIDKKMIALANTFTPRALPSVNPLVRPSAVDFSVENDVTESAPGAAGAPTLRRGTVNRLTASGALPPLRAGPAGDPFKAAGPVFLPPLQRNPATGLSGFPPARSSIAAAAPGAPPRRPAVGPSFALPRGPLPSFAKPSRPSKASSDGDEAERIAAAVTGSASP